MKTEEAVKIFDEAHEKMHAYRHAVGVLNYDAVTGAPAASDTGRGRTLGVLIDAAYAIQTAPELQEAAQTLRDSTEADWQKRREAELFLRESEYASAIPQKEYVDYCVMQNRADAVWHQAKLDSDFPAFEPFLQQLFDCNRRFAGYFRPDGDPYEVLLNRYERGLTKTSLDAFFSALQTGIVPLFDKVRNAGQPDLSFLKGEFPLEAQRRFSDDLMAEIGIDRRRCSIGETEHPFTENFNRDDVRITTHYLADDPFSSMYSVIHEGGHALYEMGVRPEYDYTELGGGCSMSVHESQSRFYENIIGRSRAFMPRLLPLLKKHFPQFASVTEDQLYRAVNVSRPSLIRTEADELTYSLHVLIRYEVEKAVMDGSLRVHDIPAAWNELMKKYIGIEVPDDRRGCLQDSHWAGGLIGYFPSYALGSAYGAQLLHVMNGEFDVAQAVSSGRLSAVTDWLTEHIWQYGVQMDPTELMEQAFGGSFDPSFYTAYLTEKYTALYGLQG